jgi:hypothetical protein
MRNHCSAFLSAIVILCAFSIRVDAQSLSSQKQSRAHSETPRVFVENRGQIVDENGIPRPDILFTLRNGNTSIFLNSKNIYYQFEKIEFPEGFIQDSRKVEDIEKQEALRKQIKRSTHRMSLSLKSANVWGAIVKEEPQSYTENYYLPQCRNGITGIQSFGRITFKDVYPGIDWVIYSNKNESGITYDFIVHPGADPNKIKLKIDDADAFWVSENGELLMKNRLGFIKENAPVSFCGNEKIETKFIRTKEGIGFALGEYDRSQNLRIDPTVIWATYFGGNNSENGQAVATDSLGNVFIAGYTSSTAMLAHAGFQMSNAGDVDAYLAKFDEDGNRLWATYFGGDSTDQAYGCAADASGNIYCAGFTKSDSLATANAFRTANVAGTDAFLAKFNTTGALQWCTYFGGDNKLDGAYGCATDHLGNVFIAGNTNSPGMAFNNWQNLSYLVNGTYAFVAKFDGSGNRLWSVVVGGSTTGGSDCATDTAGNVYMCGQTLTQSGLASPGAFKTSLTPSIGRYPTTDAILLKLDANSNLLWSTYYGGSDNDVSWSCTTDRVGSVYMLGTTSSQSGIASGGFQNAFVAGSANTYLVKFSSTGQRIWGTYYAGNNVTDGYDCSTDRSGNVYFAGETNSSSGIASGGMQNTLAGQKDMFIVKLDSNCNRIWSSYYGGSNNETLGRCATDRFGNVYLLGNTSSSTGIVKNGFQTVLNGPVNSFLVKIADTVSIKTDSLQRLNWCAGDTVRIGFHSYGTFNPGNIYTAELSDANGLFNVPLKIGTLVSTKNIDTVVSVVPASVPAGRKYRVRISSSAPGAIGRDNRVDIAINRRPAQPGPIIGNDTSCVGSTQLYRVDSVDGAVSYIWTLPPTWSGSSNADTILATVGSAGGRISIVAVNACGQSLPSSRSLVAGNYLVTPTVMIPHGVKCKNKSNLFQAVTTYAGRNPVFQWKKNGVNVGSNSASYFDSALLSGDVISVEMTSNAQCLTQTQAVSNNDTVVIGIPTVPGINVNSFPPILLCEGAPILFVSNIVNGGSTPKYQWYKSGSLIPSATASTYTDSMLMNGDTLFVALYSSDVCPVTQPTISNRVGVTVYPNLPTAVSITASPDSIIRGFPVTFTASPVNGGSVPNYVWYLNAAPKYFDTSNVWVTNNLKDGDVVTVRMTSNVPCPVPLTITSPGLLMRSYTTSVLPQGRQTAIRIYPNPVDDILTVELNGSTNDGLLTISDALGRTVFSSPVNATKCSYDLSGLATGVYVYRIRVDGENCFGKILKK